MSHDIASVIEETIRRARTWRNLAAPVNRLPVEILTSIFTAVGFKAMDMFAVSHTCHHWREISLSYPLMWTSVDLDTIPSAYIASKIFRRGGDNPLHLKCGSWDNMRLQILSFELPRMMEFEMILGLTPGYPEDLVQCEAPALRRLRILTVSPQQTVLLHLPLVRSPQLKDLTVIGPRPVLLPHNFRGLTKLHLSCSESMSDFKVPLDGDILGVLSNCPDLEDLWLEHISSRITHFANIQLSHLRIAKLILSIHTLHHILVHVSAPSLRQLTCVSLIRASISADMVVDILLDRRAIPSTYYSSFSSLSTAQSLVVDNFASCLFAFEQNKTEDPCLAYHSHESRGQFSTLPKILINLVTYHPMRQVRNLTLRNPRIPEVQMFLESLEELQKLEIIFMAGPTTPAAVGNRDIIQAILYKVKTSQNFSICSHLQMLALERVFIGLDAISDLVELRQYCPDLKYLQFHWCKSDFRLEEATELLMDTFRSVDWINQGLRLQ